MHLDPERWARVQALFHDALELSPLQRRPFLENRCGDDDQLLAEVLELIAEDARSGSLIESDLASVAGLVLDGSVPRLEKVGPYRIVSVLGHGGMGVVYLAERDDLGSRAAIKVLRDASLSPARRDRFASEQRTLAQLSHDSIARLYDADTLADGTPYFVMQYVEGEPLTDYCVSHRLSITQRLRLFRAVCEAVRAAHRQAIIHRDLKPSNILVTADGKPMLLDFGIARQLETLDSPADLTRTGLRMMTPAYAAPEQVRGEPIGTYTDVYALGVILYELLAGRRPFDLSNLTPGQAETLIANTEPVRPSTAAADTGAAPATVAPAGIAPGRAAWADLDVLCLTAMHKDPQRRYRTVEALARDVDHYLRAEPLEARPDSIGYRTGKFLRRNMRAVSLAAAAVIGITTLVIYYTVHLAAARDDALAETSRAQRLQQFTINLFQGGDSDVGPADSLRVITLLDRGVLEAGVLDGEPVTQAELYMTLGAIFQQIGNLERADSLLELALEQRRSMGSTDAAGTASSMVALGLLRVEQANLEEGERLIREGLALSGQLFPLNHPAILHARTALGKVLQERGEYDEAIAVLEEVVRIQSPRGASRELSDPMGELANTHFYAGNLAASDSLNRIILDMDRRLYGERHPVIGGVLINLGAVRFQQGDYADAERYYRQALDIIEAYFGPDHPETASSLTMLGRSLVYQDRGDEALTYLTRALSIQEQVYGAVHPAIASTSNDLGVVALQRDDHAAAARYFRRMVDIYDSVYGDDHFLLGIATANLASVHLAQERYDLAEPLFREAIAVFTRTLGADNIQTGIARIKLGRVLARERRYVEAERELLGGYQTLTGQTSPSVSWLQSARRDLIALYDATDRPEQAERFRAELADSVRGGG